MSVPRLIAKKSEGKELLGEEIKTFITKVTNGDIHESQIGAMLMAMFLKGLSPGEIVALTQELVNSGTTLSWPAEWDGLVVDKHSTGGVGDKVSLVLAPTLAASGLKVPRISGRGLGHTGGTLDKLEAIPGCRVVLSTDEMRQQLDTVGCFIASQTRDICPAEKKLYAIRDVTSTVAHIGLISACILAKKKAENISTLVLDVKTGKGAFMSEREQATAMAELMVECSNGLGIKTTALITDMNSPLGHMVGNALEVAEAIQCLQNKGPQDLTDLVVDIGGHILYTNHNAPNVEDGCNQIRDVIANGQALSKFCAMMKAQGVDPQLAQDLCDANNDPRALLPRAEKTKEFTCTRSGYVHNLDALAIAETSHGLGAGRNKPQDTINWAVGVELLVELGDPVREGQSWAVVHYDDENALSSLSKHLEEAIDISNSSVPKTSRLLQVIA